jgi:hypothetical protein
MHAMNTLAAEHSVHGGSVASGLITAPAGEARRVGADRRAS